MPTQGQSQRSSGPSRDVWIVWVQHKGVGDVMSRLLNAEIWPSEKKSRD